MATQDFNTGAAEHDPRAPSGLAEFDEAACLVYATPPSRFPQCYAAPRVGEVGFYRKDPGHRRSPFVCESLSGDGQSAQVFLLRERIDVPIDRADWMSFDEFVDQTRALAQGKSDLAKRMPAIVTQALVDDRLQVLRVALQHRQRQQVVQASRAQPSQESADPLESGCRPGLLERVMRPRAR